MKHDVLDTPWKEAILLEMKVASITRQQELYGWVFDTDKCINLISRLDQEIREIDDRLIPNIPFRRVAISKPDIMNPFKKDGCLLERVKNYFGDSCDQVVGPFSKVEWQQVSLGSQDQVKEYLLTIGWEPDEWNINKDTKEKTSPKLTETSLIKLTEGVGGLIGDRFVRTHRRSLLEGLLGRVRPDGRIEARANTMGTPTARYRHSGVVNIPKAEPDVYLGYGIRSLFTVPSGKKLVGFDAKGLEQRMMAHYINDPDLTKLMTEPEKDKDFHTKVWKICSRYVSKRSIAKNCFYCIVYGGQDTKLGKTADILPEGMTYAQVGGDIRALIMKHLPALGALIEGVQRAAKRGYLYGLDGRKIYIRSRHSALNALFQCAGSVVMKVALCFLDNWIKREQLDAHIVGHFHDEGQIESSVEHAERVAELARLSIVKAGEWLKLNCALEGDVKIADNWAQTH